MSFLCKDNDAEDKDAEEADWSVGVAIRGWFVGFKFGKDFGSFPGFGEESTA